MPSRSLRAALAGALLLALPRAAAAREVVVPLRLDPAFLRQALLTQVYTGAGRHGAGVGRRFRLQLPRPVRSAGRHAADRLRIRSAGRGRVGTPVGDSCLTLIDWTGTVELD